MRQFVISWICILKNMSDSEVELCVTCFVFFIVLAVTYLYLGKGKRYTNLPPGPRPLPFIGNFLQLYGKDFRNVCKEYRVKYGNIFTLRVFNKIIIVISGYEELKDVFVKHGCQFSGREPSFVSNFYKGQGIAFSSGKIWSHNRRFTLHTLKDFGVGKSKLQTKIHEEITHLLVAIEDHCGQPFDIKHLLNLAVSNVICSIVFGHRFEYTDEEFLNFIRRSNAFVRSSASLKPFWTHRIPGDLFGVKESKENTENILQFISTRVQEHLLSYDENNIRDFIDAYIKQMKDGLIDNELTPMNEDSLTRIVFDLVISGKDTSVAVLRFGVAFLMNYPDVHARVYNELSNVVPRNRLPEMGDRTQLPYVQAAILETLRRGNIAPLALMHTPMTDAEIRGYTIPKTARLVPNLESVLMDESMWVDPLKFNPSRFMNEDQSIVTKEHFIPFSLGPRACVGEALARMEIYLFLTAMIQRYDFQPPEGDGPPSLESRGVWNELEPFKLRAVARV